MINLLYIGNKLSKSKTVTTIDTLGLALENQGFRVSYASSYKNKFKRFIDMCFSVIKNRETVDYVLIDTYSTINFYYAFIVAQLCKYFKLKYIPILHGGKLPNRLRENPRLCNLIFKEAYINVSPSVYIKEEFNRFDVIQIPNTIELSNYRYLEKKIEDINLLWVRSFSEIYNPKLAVDILLELKKKYPRTTLTMVGPEKDGSLKETKHYANSKKVEVNFTGRLSKLEWIRLSEKHNIFINTTNFDNMPVSVIEAMALGLPVISTNVGGMSYLIDEREDGFLVMPNKPEGFVEKVELLKRNPQLTKRITHNARRKVENFDWNVVKYKWIELLK